MLQVLGVVQALVLGLQTLVLVLVLPPPTEAHSLQRPQPLSHQMSQLDIDQGHPVIEVKSHLEAPLDSDNLFHPVNVRERTNLGHFGFADFHLKHLFQSVCVW